MDRNLGATSATPGDVGALGLLYQWGRKDPFLGSSSIDGSSETAKSTINWPSPVISDLSNGTIAYATEHPTTFITYNNWHYPGSFSTDSTRWQSQKTIYDPCPVGWRVPDGGEGGVWSIAKGSSLHYERSYDDTDNGMNFSSDFGESSTIWYPASGCRSSGDGALRSVGDYGIYWSITPNGDCAYYLGLDHNDDVYHMDDLNRSYAVSVRCLQVID